ncbi:MAG: hypothetical protein KGJ02_03935 [Verrucomicrobiota bacterium]|nr:hypothetical protein [Verrucomicrobiota bacterium]
MTYKVDSIGKLDFLDLELVAKEIQALPEKTRSEFFKDLGASIVKQGHQNERRLGLSDQSWSQYPELQKSLKKVYNAAHYTFEKFRKEIEDLVLKRPDESTNYEELGDRKQIREKVSGLNKELTDKWYQKHKGRFWEIVGKMWEATLGKLKFGTPSEAGATLLDFNSKARNKGNAVLAARGPNAALAMACTISGVVATPFMLLVGGLITKNSVEAWKKAKAIGDKEGQIQAFVGGLGGASYTALGAAFPVGFVPGLCEPSAAGVAAATAGGFAINALALVLYSAVGVNAARSLSYIEEYRQEFRAILHRKNAIEHPDKELEKSLFGYFNSLPEHTKKLAKERTGKWMRDREKALQSLLFLRQQITLTEADKIGIENNEEAKKKKFEEKWDKFIRRVGKESAVEVGDMVDNLLRGLFNKDRSVVTKALNEAKLFINRIDKASFREKAKQVLLLTIAALGLTASILGILSMTMGGGNLLLVYAILSAVTAGMWLTTDWRRCHIWTTNLIAKAALKQDHWEESLKLEEPSFAPDMWGEIKKMYNDPRKNSYVKIQVIPSIILGIGLKKLYDLFMYIPRVAKNSEYSRKNFQEKISTYTTWGRLGKALWIIPALIILCPLYGITKGIYDITPWGKRRKAKEIEEYKNKERKKSFKKNPAAADDSSGSSTVATRPVEETRSDSPTEQTPLLLDPEPVSVARPVLPPLPPLSVEKPAGPDSADAAARAREALKSLPLPTSNK